MEETNFIMMSCEPSSHCYLLSLHVVMFMIHMKGIVIDQLSIICLLLCVSFSSHPKNTSEGPSWLKKKKKSIGRSMDHRAMRFLLR
jgi:hypothetical protein